jgi:hypothetical protein
MYSFREDVVSKLRDTSPYVVPSKRFVEIENRRGVRDIAGVV